MSDYGIISIADEETLSFVLAQSSEEGTDDFIIDKGDNSAVLASLNLQSSSTGGCQGNGEQHLIIVRSPGRAIELEKVLSSAIGCEQHSHKYEVVVVTDDAKPFEPFDPYDVVNIVTTGDGRAHQIMPSLSALRTLGAIDPEEVFWEEFNGLVMSLAD
jgi:hypothetical protein